MTGSAYPLVQNDGFEILQVAGEGHSIIFDLEAMKKDFRIEHAKGVFKLSDQNWSEFPHFSQAFYHEEPGIVLLSAFIH
jgi:hypothetical protein